MFDEVFEEIGDISGSVTLDIGSGGGYMISYLIKKKDLERVFASDISTFTIDSLKQKLSPDEMLRVVSIKADLRRMDFLKDCFFDLVTAYGTLTPIEMITPGGTKNVLSEIYRVLKSGRSFIIIEHCPIDLIEPIDEAQKVMVSFWRLSEKIIEACGEPSFAGYTPQSLIKIAEACGFKVDSWKEVKTTCLQELSEYVSYVNQMVQRIPDKDVREKLTREVEGICVDARKYGIRSIPQNAIYASKPSHDKQKKIEYPELVNLYGTVHHKDALGY